MSDEKNTKQVLVEANKPIHIGDLCSKKYLKMHEQCRRVYDESGVSPALNTCNGGNRETKIARNDLKIVRKITPKEAHRLMGFEDIDYENCKAVGMSDTQGYHQTGNSIMVSVVSLLAEHLYKAQYDNNYKCLDEKMNQNTQTE